MGFVCGKGFFFRVVKILPVLESFLYLYMRLLDVFFSRGGWGFLDVSLYYHYLRHLLRHLLVFAL